MYVRLHMSSAGLANEGRPCGEASIRERKARKFPPPPLFFSRPTLQRQGTAKTCPVTPGGQPFGSRHRGRHPTHLTLQHHLAVRHRSPHVKGRRGSEVLGLKSSCSLPLLPRSLLSWRSRKSNATSTLSLSSHARRSPNQPHQNPFASVTHAVWGIRPCL